MPGNDERRPPARDGAGVESVRLNDTTSVPQPPSAPLDDAPLLCTWHVDPLRLNGYAHEVWLAGHADGYDAGVAIERRRGGYGAGFAAGWTARVEQEHAAWQAMAAAVKRAGGPFSGLRFSELADLRGEREAADLARAREQLLLHRVPEVEQVAR